MQRLRVELAAVFAVLAVLAFGATGCGTSAASPDGGAAGAAGAGSGGTTGAGGSAGAAGSGGTTGAGGRAGSGPGGSGGGGGSAASPCPASLPTLNETCTVPRSCYYEDCTDTGRTVARCVDGAWSLDTGPCASGVFCQAETCPIGQICLERIGGALITECVQNTCGTGPIGCDCLQSCAGSSCTVGGSVQSGVTIMCNTCPTNTCA